MGHIVYYAFSTNSYDQNDFYVCILICLLFYFQVIRLIYT